jgi:hypothetical protein
MGTMTSNSARKRKSFEFRAVFQKKLLLPAEHGSWSWLLVPLAVGASIGGGVNPAVALIAIGSLSAFLLRQPATAWLRIRRGRGRRSNERLAAGWTAVLGVVTLGSVGSLLVGGYSELLWLLAPLLPLFAVYLGVARSRPASLRSLWLEIAGATALAASAPAAYIAASGSLDATAWLLWLLMGLQNVTGVLYVRQRLADTKQVARSKGAMLGTHIAAVAVVSLLAWNGRIPALTVAPFAAFLARAVWASAGPRPVRNIKRFGFLEVGVEVVGGLLVIIAFTMVS